jgi:hypothetical protein
MVESDSTHGDCVGKSRAASSYHRAEILNPRFAPGGTAWRRPN